MVLFWAFGCRKTVLDNTQNTGRDYFPLTRGSWWLYQVDTIFYNEFSGDTVLGSAELLERADTLIITDNGLTAMRLERYSRPLGATAWGAPRIWWATLTDRHALKSEENNIYAKLAFPLTPNASWNGNVYNIFPEQRYTVKSIDNPYSGPFLNFDSVCTVQQLFYEDLLQYRRYEEIFARRVGLVWKLEMDVTGSTQPADIGKYILDRIKGGVVRKYALKDYSIEP
ncbi:MAG: hypothetical protein N2050_09720 [Flavobacteriales bacterium]|nr:hypothetical protein [Flavobacteriales bacterium]